jgi:hypothetical protein
MPGDVAGAVSLEIDVSSCATALLGVVRHRVETQLARRLGAARFQAVGARCARSPPSSTALAA